MGPIVALGWTAHPAWVNQKNPAMYVAVEHSSTCFFTYKFIFNNIVQQQQVSGLLCYLMFPIDGVKH